MILLDFALYEGVKYVKEVNEIAINTTMDVDIKVWKLNGIHPRSKEFDIIQTKDHHTDISKCLPVGTEPNKDQYIGKDYTTILKGV